MNIGRNLTIIMYDRKITSKELAEAAEVSVGMINYIKQGEKIPSVPVLNKIAKRLEVKMDDLVNGDFSSLPGKSEEINTFAG